MKVKCIKINPFGKRWYISKVPARDFKENHELFTDPKMDDAWRILYQVALSRWSALMYSTEVQEALHLSLCLLYGTDTFFASANAIF